MENKEGKIKALRPLILRGVCFIFLYFLLIISAPPSLAQSSSTPLAGEIVISEIMMNPQAVSDTAGEWFEIYNNTERELDLMGCEFSDNGSNSFSISSNLTIASEDWLVLARNQDENTNGGVAADFEYSSFVLANSEDEIILNCDNILIDEVIYSQDLDFSLPTGKSILLKDLDLDNTAGENWCISSSAYGDGDKGTPSKENDQCQSQGNGGNTTLSNKQPWAEAGPDQTGLVGEEIFFDGTSSSDPEGMPLQFFWDFGDGATSTSSQPTHIYTQANVYLVTLRVDDGHSSNSDSLAIKIKNKQQLDLLGKLILSELLPNPLGDDINEWIELKNISDQEIDLKGVGINDATKKIFTLKNDDFDNLIIPPQGFFLIPRAISKISLNNSPPEAVSLLDPQGQILDQITYEQSAKNNTSLALINSQWQWTTQPTPLADNQISPIYDDPTETEENDEDKNSKEKTDQDDKQILSDSEKEAVCYTTTGNIILNELWPSPQGDDREFEFIELKNLSNKKIDLCDYSLHDKTSSYILPVGTIVEPQGFFVLPRSQSSLSLNNTGDTIQLYDPDSVLLDETTYPAAKTNWSWIKLDSTWQWSLDVTPEETNHLIPTNSPNSNTTTSDKNNKNKSDPGFLPISLLEIEDFSAGDKLQVKGLVVAEPYSLGKQIMYIQNEEKGLQIYQYRGDWPDLTIGNEISIKGELSYPYGTPRLKISQSENIQILSDDQDPPVPFFTEINLLTEEMSGMLITIAGQVIEKSSSKIYLDNDLHELQIQIKPSTGISLSEIKEGDILEATGILDSMGSDIRLLPREQDDLRLVQVKGYAQKNSDSIPQSASFFSQIIKYIYAGLIALILILIGLIYKIKKAHGK